jgi:O-antigen chain-terminating methyltransferase
MKERKMANSQLTIEEVMERIREAMKAQKTATSPQTVESANYESNMVGKKELSSLDAELRRNNLKWNVNAEYPISSHRKTIGQFIVLGKKLIRKFLRWYINPPVDQQREFNGSVTRSLDVLGENAHKQSEALQEALTKIQDLEAIRDILANKADKVETVGRNEVLTLADEQVKRRLESELTLIADRLRRLERKINKGLHLEPGVQTVERLVREDKEENLDIDYFLFEQRFRGSRDDIKGRQRVYLDYFMDKSRVLDIGCGRGEFVELLLENGVGVQGIDINEDMVGYCQDRGLPVIQEDVFHYLERLDDNSLDGIIAAQVIEHLKPVELLRLIDLCLLKSKGGGVIILETINPQNPIAVSNWFYADLTHIRPVHPETIKFILDSKGFRNSQLRFLNASEKDLFPGIKIKAYETELTEFNSGIRQLNELLSGPQDYAIIAYK